MRSVRVEGEETGTVIDHETTTSTDEQVVREKWPNYVTGRTTDGDVAVFVPHGHGWPLVVGRGESHRKAVHDAAERIRKEQ